MKILVMNISLFFLSAATAFSASETGYASWYGEKFHGRATANGEVYDMNGFTAAHKFLPFNTLVRVTNLDNGKQVEVRINDRGPFVAGRIIDLAKGAAKEIDLVRMGVARVSVEVIGKHTIATRGPATYSIQVAAFRDEGNARRNREKIEARGIAVEWEKTGSGFVRLHVRGVRAADLGRVLAVLKARGFPAPLVRQGGKG